MDESIVRGLVIGATLGAVGLVAALLWKVFQSPSEGARRFKIVLALLVGAAYISVFIGSPPDRSFLIVVGVVVAAVVWIYKGSKK